MGYSLNSYGPIAIFVIILYLYSGRTMGIYYQ